MDWYKMLKKYGPKSPYNYDDKIVLPEGPVDAKMVILGEAPGEDEIWCKPRPRPFVGAAGKLLDKMMTEAGINRSECLVLNLSWERPTDNKFRSYFYQQVTEPKKMWVPTDRLKKWRRLCRQIMREIKPNVVVALGNEPLQTLAGIGQITRTRGSIYLHPDSYKVVPVVHPAAILRGWKMRSIAIHDLQRAYTESLSPHYTEPELEIKIDPEYEEVIEYLEYLITERLPVTIDLETRGNHIACLGIGHGDGRYAMVIPFMRIQGHFWKVEREAEILVRLADILLHNEVDGQNFFSFDSHIFWMDWGVVPRNIGFDTMHAQHRLYPERFGPNMGLDLGFLTSLYTDPVMNFYKDEGKVWERKIGEKTFWTYCGKDVCATRQARLKLEEELSKIDSGISSPTNTSMTQLDIYNNFTNRLAQCLLALQIQGVKVDSQRQNYLYSNNKYKIDWMQSLIDHLVTESTQGAITSLNVRSIKQMKNLLYSYWNLPRQYKSKAGKKSLTCDEDALNKLKNKFPQIELFFDLLLKQKEILQEQNFLQTPVAPDGRMRSSLNVAGTETGRLASRTPPCGYGTNFQNIKNRLRSIFVADEGKELYAVDSSQAEARVVAVLSQQWDLVDLLEGDLDVHWETAKRIFSMPPDTVYDELNKEHYRRRYISKRVLHASNYGMSWYRFKQILLTDAGIDLEKKDAEALLEAYHSLYTNIRRIFHGGVVRQLRKNRELITPYGRRRVFYDRWPTGRSGGELFRQAYAFLPQSTVADMVNHALVDFWDWSKTTLGRVNVLHQNHDEILYQATPAMARIAGLKVKELMERPIPLPDYPLIIPVEFMKGKNWAYKTKDNPDGLLPWHP